MWSSGEECYLYSNPYHLMEVEISVDGARSIITALAFNHHSVLNNRYDEELCAHFSER